jgi:hypothetical protein
LQDHPFIELNERETGAILDQGNASALQGEHTGASSNDRGTSPFSAPFWRRNYTSDFRRSSNTSSAIARTRTIAASIDPARQRRAAVPKTPWRR